VSDKQKEWFKEHLASIVLSALMAGLLAVTVVKASIAQTDASTAKSEVARLSEKIDGIERKLDLAIRLLERRP